MEVRDTLSSSLKRVESTRGKRINMFVCGPTVYDLPHMGHARTYIFFDILARYLRFKGFRVFYLMNITDIEDHIITRAKEEGIQWDSITSRYSNEFFKTMEDIKNNSVNLYAFATDYISEIISQISRLIEAGYAYETSDGIYFRVRKFEGYGKLSHQNLDSLKAGIRVDVNEHKEDPLDFALWKKRKEGEPYWPSPWGDGRPGWHIEDTAITESIFGVTYDIHGGATDLIFPHHEAEIAQMESISGKSPMVRYWIHTGHLNVENIKMSKSLKNFITVKEVLKNYWPEALRILMLSMRYNGPVNFEEKALRDSQNLAEKISILSHRVARAERVENDKSMEMLNDILKPLEDDMNTPEALARITEFVKDSLSSTTPSDTNGGEIRYVLDQLENVTGIVHNVPLPERSLDMLLDLRNEMRNKGNYESSDLIRKRLMEYGIRIEDTTNGSYLWW
jgi:cysteinyl-tRNA synthetase